MKVTWLSPVLVIRPTLVNAPVHRRSKVRHFGTSALRHLGTSALQRTIQGSERGARGAQATARAQRFEPPGA